MQLLPPEAAPRPSPDDLRLLGAERVRQGWRLLCGLLASHGVEAPWMTASLRGADSSGTHPDCHGFPHGRCFPSRVRAVRHPSWPLGAGCGSGHDHSGRSAGAGGSRPVRSRGWGALLVLSRARLNGQMELGGPDVMTRISRALASPEMAAALSDALRKPWNSWSGNCWWRGCPFGGSGGAARQYRPGRRGHGCGGSPPGSAGESSGRKHHLAEPCGPPAFTDTL